MTCIAAVFVQDQGYPLSLTAAEWDVGGCRAQGRDASPSSVDLRVVLRIPSKERFLRVARGRVGVLEWFGREVKMLVSIRGRNPSVDGGVPTQEGAVSVPA